MDTLRSRKEELELQLVDSEEKRQTLQAENLQFIKAFDEHVEQRRAELALDLDKKYQAWSQEQGRVLAEAQSQVRTVEGKLELREEKISELDQQLREQRAAFRDLASGFEEE